MTTTNTSTKPAPVATGTSPAQALFQIAVNNYQQAQAEQDRVDAELSAANAAYKAASPDRSDEFEPYGLNRNRDYSDRAALVRATEMTVAMTDYYGRSDLSADDFASIARKATSLVDDFLAYREADREAAERAYGDVQERFDAACDARCTAQETLLTTPAPDADALLFKLDLLAKVEREHCTDDADSVEAIAADAHRLLGSN